MKVIHHGIEAELLDSWWSEANMEGFIPQCNTFRTYANGLKSNDIFEVNIHQILPVIRASGVGIFNSNYKATAQERVVNILHAI